MRALATLGVGLLLAGCALRAVASPGAEQQVAFDLQPVTGDIWRYTAGAYHGVLLDTDAGVVVTDPLSLEAATWLKGQVAERFDKPIVTVLYSHNHPDHAAGGQGFDGPGTQFVAHALAARDWERLGVPVRTPDVTFTEDLTLHIGDQTIELRHHGRNNGLGSVSMHFVEQGVLHVVDWVVVGRVPYADLPGYDINGMLDSTAEILELDFDVFIGGHADIGDRAGVERYQAYLQSLHHQVRDGILAGQDLETLQEQVDLSEFSDLASYDAWRDDNIAGVYRQLRDISYLDKWPEAP